jgi:hypothetical protein
MLLSAVPKFSSTDLKSWLEHETDSVFIPVHTKAKRMLEEMRSALGNLADASKMLLDNSAKEIEKRNMKTYGRARALNKLAKLFVERLRQLKIPDQVTYDSASILVKELQKAFAVTDVDVRNWFPRISPFFILDRRKFSAVFEKAKAVLKELENFVLKEYVKTKTLEETFQLLDKVTLLEKQLKELAEKKARVESDVTCLEKEISEYQHKIDDLRTMGGIGQLSLTGNEISALCDEVKHDLQHLQKPFVKLQSLATHGSGSGLTPEELKKIGQYLEDPFTALSAEETGYPLLRQILEKLRKFLSEDSLKLKPEKARKAEQAIDHIVDNDSLTTLYHKCREAQTRKTQLSMSEEVAMTQKDIAKHNEQLDLLKRNKGVLEADRLSISRNHTETSEKIRNYKDEIERNVFDFLAKKIVVV